MKFNYNKIKILKLFILAIHGENKVKLVRIVCIRCDAKSRITCVFCYRSIMISVSVQFLWNITEDCLVIHKKERENEIKQQKEKPREDPPRP